MSALKCWVVIPARYGSTRFPGKPLALINGRPLLRRVIDRAKKINRIEGVLVATDDPRIFDLAVKCGAEAVMTDSHLPTGTDRIYQASRELKADLIINLQGDEPLFNPLWIEKLIDVFFADQSLNMATLAHPIAEEDMNSMNSVKVILNQRHEALYFSRFAIPYSREKFHSNSSSVFKHVGIYAYRKEFLKTYCSTPQCEIEKAESLEQLRALDMGEKIKVLLVEDSSIGVDTPEDIKKVEPFIVD